MEKTRSHLLCYSLQKEHRPDEYLILDLRPTEL